MSSDAAPIDDLVTVRDHLRWAISRFNEADLSYGHGTANALDEAAYLILHTLHLPIDSLEPWLDARLTRSERQAVCNILQRRISTRKPAPYLTGEAWIGGHRFYVDERVIVPRSYIGEMLCAALESDDPELMPLGFDPSGVDRILDLCTGGGSLAILAALAFPGAQVDAVDISADALDVARRNVADYDFEERVKLILSDLFAGLGGQRYDLIISNPPYVTDAAVAAFPPEHHAEPVLAHAAGADGLDLVHRILATAVSHLTPEGHLLMEVGTGRQALESAYPTTPFLWLDTAESHAEVLLLSRTDLDRLGRVPTEGKRRKGRSL